MAARPAAVSRARSGSAMPAGNFRNGSKKTLFSGDETTDVGTDSGTPVSDDHGAKETEFTGQIDWVQLDIDEAAEDLDHMITPEERLRVAMARQ